MKNTFLIITVAFVTTFATTGYSGMASAQENNKTVAVQSQDMQNTTTTNNTKVSVVLVHGAWADGSSWSKVIPILEKAGHRVIAVQLPLHSLKDDVDTVKRAIDVIGGPVILVGHSYGGEVITNAGYNNPKVKGLVFIAALAPKEGQFLNDFVNIKKFPKGLLIADSDGFLYLNPSKFHDVIAQDVNMTQANIAAAVQKPFNQLIFSEKSGPPAWKQIHSWYQISENDHALPPVLEHQFAKQINATTISIPSGHASLISHPNEVSQLILDATKGVIK